ncbi:twin-arginine translocation signal domain-containing protein [Candidatus Sodalis pierantonius]
MNRRGALQASGAAGASAP